VLVEYHTYHDTRPIFFNESRMSYVRMYVVNHLFFNACFNHHNGIIYVHMYGDIFLCIYMPTQKVGKVGYLICIKEYACLPKKKLFFVSRKMNFFLFFVS